MRIETSSPTVTEGQTLDLNCVVVGRPQATITWYKRGGSLPARHQVLTHRTWKGVWVVGYIGVTAWQAGMEPLLGSGKASYIPVMAGQVRGSRLYILQASPADAGEYVCRAGNGQEATITVTVTRNHGANLAYRE